MKNSIKKTGILAGLFISALAVNATSIETQSEILGNGSQIRTAILDAPISSVTNFVENKCGEGKCGSKESTKTSAKKTKTNEAKCGEGKCGEGKCGSKTKSTKTSTKKTKTTEAKCGEGKCGAKK